jgi:hypothetical protein
VEVTSQPSSYFTIEREWKTGDAVELRLPMTLRTEALPHSGDNIVAILYGPNLLAGIVPARPGVPDPAKQRWDDHLKAPGKVPGTRPVFVAQDATVLLRHFQPTGKGFAEFRSVGVTKPEDLTFLPLHRVYEEHYAVYFPLLSPADWAKEEAAMRALEEREARLDAATVDRVQPGFQQSEVEHGFQSEASQTGDHRDRKWRDARGWFSYDVAVDPTQPMVLVCTYWGGDRGRSFDILVDGQKLATQKLENETPNQFIHKSYSLPATMTRGREKVNVRFAATSGSVAGGLFGLRMARATPELQELLEQDQ